MIKAVMFGVLIACASAQASLPPVKVSGQSYLSTVAPSTVVAGQVNLSGTHVTGVLPSSKGGGENVYYHYPVVAGVVENDIVMNAVATGTGQAPLSFKKAVNNDTYYYPQLYGVAKNVSGGFADIWMGVGTVVDGFSFGAFIGVDYYLDGATPGALTFTPPVSGANPIKIGRALDATHLILDPKGNFVQSKGAIYTSDGAYDGTLVAGTNGAVPFYNSAATYGMSTGPAVVATAPLVYTTATRALTCTTATDSVAGCLSAANHTTYTGYAASIALKANAASPTFTGDGTFSSGNVLISQIGKGVQIKTGANSKIGTATLVAGTVTVTNTSVTANSLIFITRITAGGTAGTMSYTKVNGTSFTLTSSSAADTSTLGWYIVEMIP